MACLATSAKWFLEELHPISPSSRRFSCHYFPSPVFAPCLFRPSSSVALPPLHVPSPLQPCSFPSVTSYPFCFLDFLLFFPFLDFLPFLSSLLPLLPDSLELELEVSESEDEDRRFLSFLCFDLLVAVSNDSSNVSSSCSLASSNTRYWHMSSRFGRSG